VQIQQLHGWDLSNTEAIALQKKLAERVDVRAPLTNFELVAGADISYERFSDVFYAGVVVIRVADGTIVEKQSAVRRSPFPYIPGLLSFREAPALLEAFAKVESKPDVIMLDGQGLAHPRRFGLACHVGLWLERPSVGCAKTVLIGTFKDLGDQPGSLAPLCHREEVLGSAVRTKKRTKPVLVSAGHQIDLPSSVRVVLGTCKGYRIPEPTRQAHLFVNQLRAAGVSKGKE
jgi:deoxyribonuclease V